MSKKHPRRTERSLSETAIITLAFGLCVIALGAALMYRDMFAIAFERVDLVYHATTTPTVIEPPKLDFAQYDMRMRALAHASTTATSTPPGALWPVKTVYPQAGALLPFHRIVAYYGNFYSTGMGVLGQYPPEEMLARLASTSAMWAAADPTTPVLPAIDYIAVTAQADPEDGTYRLRMPLDQVQKAVDLADQVHGIVILDVQVGLSTLQKELPRLEPYLKMPNVELAIDPEFAMHNGAKPGTVIGSFSAADINYAAQLLASIVRENHLPPKILVVHRFTEEMVTNYKGIAPLPEVQIVMDMDGWGDPAKKINTYNVFVYNEPVQFTGFKLFYKNDIKPPSTRMLLPREVLNLTPAPVFIQYQ